ncbi:uncharacterized protein LOC124909722, partial [Impatiens glandulifera]|uniref:uncharacterized protein LOC124909722 n=1 Tax=Impatiens glandulifera TaxID=253017 RepID=UPI001FB1591F
MGNPPRIRKRVQATRRAPDGSAFQNCTKCGVLVPIALEDMHECDVEKDVMIGKIGNETQIKSNQRFQHQPKSAFRFFMESFLKNCEGNDNQIEDDREGFNKWRKISEK